MTLSKTNMLLIVAAVGAAFLIERGNRIRIEAPAAVEGPPVKVFACLANRGGSFAPECGVAGARRVGNAPP